MAKVFQMILAEESEKKMFSMTRVSLFGIVFFMQISAYGKPTWNTPIFLDVSPSWSIQKNISVDSQVFTLSNGSQIVTFDYGRRGTKDKVWCSISQIPDISKLDDLKCISSTKQHQKIKRIISIKDPKDEDSFGLVIFVSSRFVGADDRELVALLKSIQFVGGVENLKLISINFRKRQAMIMDESGVARIVKRNDLIARNFGKVREVKKDYLLIEEFLLDANGDFKSHQIELHLKQ